MIEPMQVSVAAPLLRKIGWLSAFGFGLRFHMLENPFGKTPFCKLIIQQLHCIDDSELFCAQRPVAMHSPKKPTDVQELQTGANGFSQNDKAGIPISLNVYILLCQSDHNPIVPSICISRFPSPGIRILHSG